MCVAACSARNPARRWLDVSESLAKGSVAAGVSLFGVSLADISTAVTIFAGIAGSVASIAAALYYFDKWWKGR
jgi:hypothetical protein